MVNLQALSPCRGLLPLTIGAVSFTEVLLPESKVWSVSPSPVKPGASKRSKSAQIIWIGRDHALQIGGTRPRSGRITDQSDGWACVAVEGADAQALMARLCPVDLANLAEGQVVRSLVNHMQAIILATEDGFQIMVFRAFAQTLIEELKDVAIGLEGRNQLGL